LDVLAGGIAEMVRYEMLWPLRGHGKLAEAHRFRIEAVTGQQREDGGEQFRRVLIGQGKPARARMEIPRSRPVLMAYSGADPHAQTAGGGIVGAIGHVDEYAFAKARIGLVRQRCPMFALHGNSS